MPNKSLFVALGFALFLLAPTASASCDLSITVSCASGRCTSVTTNHANAVCSGSFISYFSASSPNVSMSGMTTSLGLDECFSAGDFELPEGTPWAACLGEAALGPNGTFTAEINVGTTGSDPSLQVIGATYVYDPISGNELGLAYAFSDSALPTCTPVAAVPSVTQSNLDYTLAWSPVVTPSTFEVEESTTPDFTANVVRQTVSAQHMTFRHDVTTSTTYYYRVRATSCNGAPGPYSTPVQIVVQAVPANGTSGQGEVTVPFGSSQPASTRLFIPGRAEATAFVATTDKPFLTVSPSSGTLPPEGATLTVTADPNGLQPGASTGTVTVSNTVGEKITTAPVTISLVTPVGPGRKSIPTANTLIIPVVTHVNAGSGPFQSDVRLTNASSQAIEYVLTLTPTRTDGTTGGKATQIKVEGGKTIALNDIVKNFFGFGATGAADDVGFGALEIRPLNTSSNLTYASSRTFVTTARGTLGQFIAAVPFSEFATRASTVPIPGGGGSDLASPVMSLQQVAQSATYRTNLGLVEGSGTPASGSIRIYNTAGQLLQTAPYSLLPGEHQQINQFLSTVGIPNLEDGRIEITVDSPTGAVTGYASVLDQETTDPLAVMPVQAANVQSTRYVLPGVADINNGAANFHSDVRIYNGGLVSETMTLTYFPQSQPEAATQLPATITIAPGEVKAFDNILPSLFGLRNTGGSLLVTTPRESSLVVTGRTYSIGDENGTYGLFVPGITPQEARGAGEPALQILQLEQSPKFRTNLGIAEVTGNGARIRITLAVPDSLATPSLERDVRPNEFFQIVNVIDSFLGAGANSYNARVYVEVISGAGRITAYGSVIDNATQDPTYVPAQ